MKAFSAATWIGEYVQCCCYFLRKKGDCRGSYGDKKLQTCMVCFKRHKVLLWFPMQPCLMYKSTIKHFVIFNSSQALPFQSFSCQLCLWSGSGKHSWQNGWVEVMEIFSNMGGIWFHMTMQYDIMKLWE